MAIAAHAVPAIAEVLGRPIVTAETLARIEKRAEPPLWLRTGRGRTTRAPHMQPWHGVNLMLGLVCADPLADAPKLVRAYRALPAAEAAFSPDDADPPDRFGGALEAVLAWHRVVSSEAASGLADFRLLPGATFGEGLDNLVDWIGRREGQAVRAHFRTLGFWVDVPVGISFPTCTAGLPSEDGRTTLRTHYFQREGTWPASGSTPRDPGVILTARIFFKVFETLADLAADGRAATLGASLPSPSGTAHLAAAAGRKAPGVRSVPSTPSPAPAGDQSRRSGTEPPHSSDASPGVRESQSDSAASRNGRRPVIPPGRSDRSDDDEPGDGR